MTRLYATGTAHGLDVSNALDAWHSHDRIETLIAADDDVGVAALLWASNKRGVHVETVLRWYELSDDPVKARDEQAARLGFDRVLTDAKDARDFGSATVRRVRT